LAQVTQMLSHSFRVRGDLQLTSSTGTQHIWTSAYEQPRHRFPSVWRYVEC